MTSLTLRTAMIGFFLIAATIQGQGHAPDVAASRMQTAAGLRVQLFASEPDVRQPILVKFDDRGRLWTIQYLQYPNPAGLKRVQVDRWSRTVYDRVPEPPPKGPRGADRITICEDTNGDGKADKFKDFVSGLNLCTGLEFGHGGVYVLQAPYLLFYADKNRDDKPDGDPQVLLSGFGMEDAQSLVNHLTWGPDGWLYGVTGSTVTNKVKGIEFQQAVWRYHHPTNRFELYCEGGGNLFGLTFDALGNLFFSSNGSMLAVHGVQGAYYRKAFDKHGPLHNPYAYGFFETIRHTGQARGPSPGGTIYLGDTLPAHFRGAFLNCDFLDHSASWWKLTPRATTFDAEFGGRLLDAKDTWFCATDLCTGPDGSVYLCDFHDKRLAHPDPDADWDRSNGRIYRVFTDGTKPVIGLDLEKKTNQELIELLNHRNFWYRDRARLALMARQDMNVVGLLRTNFGRAPDPETKLQGLWAWHCNGSLDQKTKERLLRSSTEEVRRWMVRLIGDEEKVADELVRHLSRLASSEPCASVRAQLASTARRLPPAAGFAIISRLLQHEQDHDDPHIPLLLWWALAEQAMPVREQVVEFFTTEENLQRKPVRALLPRLVRRYAAEGSRSAYRACARLLGEKPDADLVIALDQGLAERGAVLGGMGMGDLFKGSSAKDSGATKVRDFEAIDHNLTQKISKIWQATRSDPLRLKLALRAELREAKKHLLAMLADEKAPRVALLDVLLEVGDPSCLPSVLPLIDKGNPEPLQLAALAVAGRFLSFEIADELLTKYKQMTPALRSRTRDVLLSNRDAAAFFLADVEKGRIAAADVPLEQVRRVALLKDEKLDKIVRKHWGSLRSGTPEEKLAVMRRLANDLRAGKGDRARGKELYRQHCATCHRLHDDGGNIGPDLTGFARQDTEGLLASLVDPSAVVRKEFLSYVATTKRGVIHEGLLAEQDGGTITLVNAKNERTKVRREEIEELRPAENSLMPEGIVEKLKPQELRDLFSYVQGGKL